jgi:hypothetical protein
LFFAFFLLPSLFSSVNSCYEEEDNGRRRWRCHHRLFFFL